MEKGAWAAVGLFWDHSACITLLTDGNITLLTDGNITLRADGNITLQCGRMTVMMVTIAQLGMYDLKHYIMDGRPCTKL